MFIGHFALGVAVKPIIPKVPVWVLFLAPQVLDLVFIPLVLSGVENYQSGSYGQSQLDTLYSHSLVVALALSGGVYWLAKSWWKDRKIAWILAGLCMSHWGIDLLVHHPDMPILPGNLGGFPLLGLGLWDYSYSVFGIELAMAVISISVYSRWSLQQSKSPKRLIGPGIIAAIFIWLILSDYADLPMRMS